MAAGRSVTNSVNFSNRFHTSYYNVSQIGHDFGRIILFNYTSLFWEQLATPGGKMLRVSVALKGKRSWVIFFLILMFEASVAWIRVASLPADPGGKFLGFSPARLALVTLLLGIALAALLAALYSTRSSDFFDRLDPRISDRIFLLAAAAAPVCEAVLAVLWSLAGQDQSYRFTAYAQRMAPLLHLFALIGIETVAWLTFQRRKELLAAFPLWRSFLVALAWAWGVLAAVAAFVAITRTGLTPETVGSWGGPAVPLLEWQLLLVWAAGMALLLLAARPHPPLPRRFDTAVFLGLWLVTALLWFSQPLNPAYFATPPRAPNQEIYPFSDALTYAQFAQSILIGGGLMGDIPARPLYDLFLAGLHALAGQDYTRVIALQTLVLAFFPAVLYLLAKELGSRPFGLSLALLAALRDLTANQSAPFTFNTTYSKLYFSEMPVALLLSLFTLLAVRWIRRPLENPLRPFWMGGILGLSMLIRTQCAIVLPAVLLLALPIHRGRMRFWLRGVLLTLLALGLTVAPWLWRNSRLAGGLVFDHPASQTMVLAQRYTGLGFDQVIPQLPSETIGQYSSRLLRMAFDGIRVNPGPAVLGITANFLNNEIGNLLLLPLRGSLNSLAELLQPTRAFWQEWRGAPTPAQTALLLVYLAVYGAGIAAAWRLARWAGLLPLALNLSYNLWTALFRSSGDRFLVPVDWAAYLYALLGLFALGTGLLLVLQGQRPSLLQRLKITLAHPSPLPSVPSSRFPWRGLALTALLFTLLGSSLPLSERLIPARYPPLDQAALTARLLSSPALSEAGIDPGQVKTLLGQPGAALFYGRAVYPRYYAAGEGEPVTAKTGYAPSPQPRLVFYLLNQANQLAIFPQTASPAFFPNASDVLVLGKTQGGILFPSLVIVEKDGRRAAYLAPQ
jgi:hypothetical protein